jgi:hypothetical protein
MVAACSLVNMQRRNSRCMKLHGESDLVTDTMLDHKSSVIEVTGGRVRDAITCQTAAPGEAHCITKLQAQKRINQ